MGRIEILYNSIDQLAQAILKNKIPMAPKELDPCSDLFEEATWPESYLRFKKKVQEAEKAFAREPLTDLQWKMVECYLDVQYGLKLA